MAVTITKGSVRTSASITLQKNGVTALCGIGTPNATTTLGTVPANKIWRIIQATLNCSFATTETTNITAGGVVIAQNKGNTAQGEIGFHGSYNDAIVLTATQTIQTIDSLAAHIYVYNIYYIEESV